MTLDFGQPQSQSPTAIPSSSSEVNVIGNKSGFDKGIVKATGKIAGRTVTITITNGAVANTAEKAQEIADKAFEHLNKQIETQDGRADAVLVKGHTFTEGGCTNSEGKEQFTNTDQAIKNSFKNIWEGCEEKQPPLAAPTVTIDSRTPVRLSLIIMF
jgi:hypothetical protein